MRIATRRLSYTRIRALITEVSTTRYAGNLRVEPSAGPASARYGSGFDGQIKPVSLTGPGSRDTPAHRRRSTRVCWHVERDVFLEVLNRDPQARVRVREGPTLHGIEDFVAHFGATRDIPATPFRPGYCLPDLCDCPRSYR